mmetsp:Transcript_37394/g.96676  ORF Transcript_37394/g.96676 Transcript_37394/m.96676 type:complete len:530 (+) Transcript_37394:823-2412(+)
MPRVHLLEDLVELRHPRGEQVAVLQQHPRPFPRGDLHERLGLGTLALAERDGRHLLVLVLREAVERAARVRTRREDKDERREAVGVRVGPGQVEGRRRHELFAELQRDEAEHRRHHAVWADAAQHQHVLQGAQLCHHRRPRGRVLEDLHRRHVVVDLLPDVQAPSELHVEVGVALVDLGEPEELAPAAVRHPVGRLGRWILQRDASREQEAVVAHIGLPGGQQAADAEQEGEERLVLLEQTAADVAVQRVLEGVVQRDDALLQVGVLLRLVDRREEEVHEERQTVLIHRVDVGQVGDAEEEDGSLEGDRDVAETSLVDLFLRLLADFLLRRNLVRQGLGGAQDVDRALILQDVALRRLQHVQDLVLGLLELGLVLRALHHEAHLFLGQVGPLLLNDDVEQLVLQADDGDHEVDQRHLHGHLWQVVWVAELRRQVELEVLAVLQRGLADLDHHRVALLERLLQQNGLYGRVRILHDVLDEHGCPEADAPLHAPHVIAVGELRHHQLLLLLHLLDPLVGLHLRVDAKGPAA